MLIDEIIPYERNAHDNKANIPKIAESIREFGFIGQIALESRENPVIVAGHHRVEACKHLGWTEIPDENIFYCDHLNEDELKALRLADNRLGEGGKWNRALLREEIRAVSKAGLDMSRYNFDFKSKTRPYGSEMVRNNNEWNLDLCCRWDCKGKWELPPLDPVDAKPPDLISFNFCKSTSDYTPGVHFCIDDYQFTRVWNNPRSYLDMLRKFDCVVCPDFSIYIDMPFPMKLWNLYRSRALGYWWQQEGLKVIPNVTWSDKESLNYCLDGLPVGGTIFVSTVGATRDLDSRELVIYGLKRVLKELKPERLLLLGSNLNFDFGEVEVCQYKPQSFKGAK